MGSCENIPRTDLYEDLADLSEDLNYSAGKSKTCSCGRACSYKTGFESLLMNLMDTLQDMMERSVICETFALVPYAMSFFNL